MQAGFDLFSHLAQVDIPKVLKFNAEQSHELFFKDRVPILEGQVVQHCFQVLDSSVDFVATLVSGSLHVIAGL